MTDTRYRVLVTDEVDPEGLAVLRAEPEIEVVERPDAAAGPSCSRDRRVRRAGRPQRHPHLARAARPRHRLRVVGRAGVGVDNVDLERATELGIAVINAPGGNTVSVAELTFGVLLSLLRHIHTAAGSMREGEWRRSALGGGRAARPHAGDRRAGPDRQRGGAARPRLRREDDRLRPLRLAARFEELGVERAGTLTEALDRADVLTVHVPLTAETRGMIGAQELARLSPRAVVLNLARGGIVDEAALIEALRAGRVAAAGLDVFEKEPLAADHPLRIAAERAAHPAPRRLHHGGAEERRARGVRGGARRAGHRRPQRRAQRRRRRRRRAGARSARCSTSRSGSAGSARVLPGGLSAVELRYSGPREEAPRPSCSPRCRARCATWSTAAPSTWSTRSTSPTSAGSRPPGRTSAAARRARRGDRAAARGGDRGIRVGGALLGEAHGRITRIGAFRVDIAPRGTLVVLRNRDVPGVIGRVGTLLGEAGVNIAEYHQARLQAGGEALAAVSIDRDGRRSGCPPWGRTPRRPTRRTWWSCCAAARR
jgi:D-3-phosphoglycerate dehydrogenase / 2-oxoglutarate reductase